MPVTESILSVAAADPARPALVDGARRLSYGELPADSRLLFGALTAFIAGSARSGRTARLIPEAAGIPIIAISTAVAFDAARLMTALTGQRAIAAVLDPAWPLAHRARVLTAVGAALVACDEADAAELAAALAAEDAATAVVTVGALLRAAGPAADSAIPGAASDPAAAAAPVGDPAVRPADEPFLLLFSSGSTGAPKAFLKTRGQYRANVAVSTAHLDPRPGEATLAPGPMAYSLTLYAVIECLASGGSAHVATDFAPRTLLARIAAEGVSRIVAVPAMAGALAAAARRDPAAAAGVRLVVAGGAHLPDTVRADWAAAAPAAEVISYYGAAEIGFIGDSRADDHGLVRIYDGIDVEIRDDDGRVLPDGELGTLWVRAAARSDGYVAGTADAAVELVGPDGWASVHDVGRMRAGLLDLVGRAGDVANVGGHKVVLPEVDRAFDGLPGIGAACAVALPDERLGSVVALAVERAGSGVGGDIDDVSPAAAPSKAVLRDRARAALAPQFVPLRYYLVDRLPRTVGGKIRRADTAELVAAADLSGGTSDGVRRI